MPEGSDSQRLLLVTNDLGPRAGGIETFILGLLEQITHHGFQGNQVVIYTSSQSGDKNFDQELHERLGVTVIRDRTKILLPTPRVNREVAKVLRHYQCATVWFGAAAPLGWMAGHLRRAGAQRIVALTHGHEVWWSKVFPFSLAMRQMGKSVDVMTYLGEFTHRAIKPAVGKYPMMVRIAPGIDTSHFMPGEKSDELLTKYQLHNKKIIISVGRLVHRKGQDRLVEAMPIILESVPDAILVFVGEGPHREVLERLVKKNHVENYVKFIGRLSYRDLPAHFRLGDVFAMPSRSRFFGLEVEGLGIVYLEASACGVPVVAGNSGGAPDAVIQGKTGVVVNGTDLEDIAQGVTSLLKDPVLAVQMGKTGRQWIEDEWNWNLWGKKFAQLLQGN